MKGTMKRTMRAAQLVELREPLEIREVPVPEIKPDYVLVDVKATGICTSDIHYREGNSPVGKLPLTLGHEIAGVIAETGPEVNNLHVGDRVCIIYNVACGKCKYCLQGQTNYCPEVKMLGKNIDGGFAEYVAVPARNCFKVPENIPFPQTAAITDAVATPYHALSRAKVQPGDSVLVIGIGGLGNHAVQIAGVMGAGMVIAVDISEEKLQLARKLGADYTINALETDPVAKVMEITGGRGVDVAVELIGLGRTCSQAVACAATGGRVVFVGIYPGEITIKPYDLICKEVALMGSADQLPEDFPVIIDLVASGKLNLSRTVSRTITLEEINDGMEMLEKKIGNPVRIVVVQE